MLWLLKALLSGSGKVGLFILAAAFLLHAYWLIRPDTPELDPARARAADILAEEAAKTLADDVGAAWAHRYVRVARLEGDHGDVIRHRIETTLSARTHCRIVPDTLARDVRDQAVARLSRLGVIKAPTADRWRMQAIRDHGPALAEADRTQSDYVIYGSVEDFRLEGHGVTGRLALSVADRALAETVRHHTIMLPPGQSFASLTAKIGRPRWFERIANGMAWVLGIVLTPLVARPLCKPLLRAESNALNFICLIFLTIMTALLAWGMFGFGLESSIAWVVWAGVTAIAAAWNFLVLNGLERQRLHAQSF